jgi:hypothetical protein
MRTDFSQLKALLFPTFEKFPSGTSSRVHRKIDERGKCQLTGPHFGLVDG